MGSTNLNAPTLKMTSTAIGLVVILHVLAAMALVMVKSPAPIKPPASQTPPIEIELLTLPAPAAEPENNAIKPEPVAAVQPEPKPIEPTQAPPVKKAQPIEQPKPEPVVEPPKKVVAKEPIVKNTEPKKQVVEPVIDTPPEPIKTEPFEHEVIKQPAPPDDSALIEETRQIAAAKEAAEAQARQEQIEREAAQAAAAEREAQVAAQAKKDAEAARVAAEKAAAEKAAAAASNTPVDFTANNANWSSPPNLSFPNRAARGARSGDTYNVVLVLRVNKQGGIDSVRLAQSSGNAQLDRAAQRQVRSGKFKPFTKNGVPVVGNVTLPISYEVP